jgi:membrane-bound inhibitor of C-type lysozyme
VLGARYAGSSLALRLPTGTAQLRIARSASGARYTNDTLEFWEHAGEARVTRQGRLVYEHCRPDREYRALSR